MPFAFAFQTPSFPYPSGQAIADRRRIAENDMRRLLYFLLGSTLFHGVLLWVPFPMSAGSAGKNALQPVSVQLLDVPRTDARKRMSEKPERLRQLQKTRQAKAKNPRSPRERPKATTPARTRIEKTRPVAPIPVNNAAIRPQPQARPKPARPSSPTATATPAKNLRPAGVSAPVPQPQGETGGDRNAATEASLAPSVAPKTPGGHGVKAAAGFTPVRYARTVKPRYPGKARRAGWEGTAVLKVLVDPKGAPGRVTVDRTSGFDILDDAAVKAVRRWRFHPARRGVDGVPSWVRIPVAFKLKEDRLRGNGRLP